MNKIPASLRRLVFERAAERCEYCRLSQEGQEAAFHIDHVNPRAAGGPTIADNLAVACVSCSLRKGDRMAGVDPQTGREVSLFNPRQQRWADHFRWDGVSVTGLTATGRATVNALQMNHPRILVIRQEETHLGRHPAAD